MTKKTMGIYLFSIGVLFVSVVGWFAYSFASQTENFNGERALKDAQQQVAFGPRTPGSKGHEQVRAWMRDELVNAGWQVAIQETQALGHPIRNVIAKRSAESPRIILGAHYDTRLVADHDPDPSKRNDPVPGANDGASGVAVLIEMARVLPKDSVPVWLVFFDAEDNGNIEGWDWILGSRAFVNEYRVRPSAVVIVDMIGDADLNMYYEGSSNKEIREQIWNAAARLEHKQFIPQIKYRMLDDHTPFLEAGIPAVDIIDFDYPYWHTTQDTPDKLSAESLQAVGETLLAWIMEQK